MGLDAEQVGEHQGQLGWLGVGTVLAGSMFQHHAGTVVGQQLGRHTRHCRSEPAEHGRLMGEDYFVTFTSSRDDAREKMLSKYVLMIPKSKLEDTLKPRSELLEKKQPPKK